MKEENTCSIKSNKLRETLFPLSAYAAVNKNYYLRSSTFGIGLVWVWSTLSHVAFRPWAKIKLSHLWVSWWSFTIGWRQSWAVKWDIWCGRPLTGHKYTGTTVVVREDNFHWTTMRMCHKESWYCGYYVWIALIFYICWVNLLLRRTHFEYFFLYPTIFNDVKSRGRFGIALCMAELISKLRMQWFGSFPPSTRSCKQG